MKKEIAIQRRNQIRAIVLENKVRYARSVDDWWHIVGGHWPTGWNDAPSKNTVKKVLQDMHHEGFLNWRFHVQGWFQQERFW